MGKTTEELNVEINGNSKRAKAALKQTRDAMGRFSKKAKATNSVLKNFKSNWFGITAATAAAVVVVNKVVKAYAEQEKAQITLAAAMKQAGTFTEAAFQENLDYASSLQKITTFGDEAILGVQKLLTNFGVQGKEMKTLTKATTDLAAGLGIDLNTAANLVAKTVGSSTNALTRYGVEVEGSAGSTERMTSAVENITKLFGGAAQAEAKSFGGSVQQLKNIFGDFQEKIGGTIAKFLRPLVKILKSITIAFDNMPESMRIAGIAIVAVFAAAVIGAKLFGATMTVATGGISLLVGAAVAATVLIIDNWAEVGIFFEELWLLIRFAFAGTLNIIIDGLNFLIEKFNLLPGVAIPAIQKISTAFVAESVKKIDQMKKETAVLKKEGGIRTKDNKKELKKRLGDFVETTGKMKSIFTDMETAMSAISATMVDSLVDGITSWESSSKDVFANIASGFTALISGQLKIEAKKHAAMAIALAFTPGGQGAALMHGLAAGAFTVGAGAVRALGGSLVGKITSAATGADFITSGKQALIVGDNPSGQERVQVTPSESPAFAGAGGEGITIGTLNVFSNNVGEMTDSIFEQAELAGARPFKRGGFN